MNVNWNFPKEPRDWYVALAASCSISGFVVSQSFLPTWDVKTMFWVAQFFGVTSLARWFVGGVWSDVDNARTVLKIMLNKEVIQDKSFEEAKQRAKQEGMNPVDRSQMGNTKPAFAQTVEMPKLNLQSHFFTCVLRSYDLDPQKQSQVDITEKLWVIDRKMFSQKPFQNMVRKAEEAGAFKRKYRGPKAPRIVADRGVVEHYARGNQL